MDILQPQSEPNLWITDLREIEKRSLENAPANLEFADFLKTQDPEKMDSLVKTISLSVAREIDCTKCANCCKSLTVATDYPDSAKVAEALNVPVHEFRSTYMRKDFDGQMVFKKRPCPFLKDNLCSVYESRPSTCRTYPHLEKGNFIGRLGNVISNLKVCPIAFNTFELLKLNYE